MHKNETQEPSVSEGQMGKCAPHGVFNHPAYGTITMTTSSGGDKTLFGSDLAHNQRISIRISAAELHRDLCRDWIHPRNQLIEFEMSHAQFAQFITSNGNGGGTPVTIKWLPGAGSIPGIANLQTKHETHRKEIRECAQQAYEEIAKSVASLEAMIEGGKLGKKELREFVRSMRVKLGNAPANLAFAVASAEEALEKATSDAKIEVESFIDTAAKRIGLNHINDLAKIEAMPPRETAEVMSRTLALAKEQLNAYKKV